MNATDKTDRLDEAWVQRNRVDCVDDLLEMYREEARQEPPLDLAQERQLGRKIEVANYIAILENTLRKTWRKEPSSGSVKSFV